MIVYHGSSVTVRLPDIYHSRDNVDFGKGFYVTPYKEQAENWAARFKKRMGHGIVSAYELNLDICKKEFQVLEFTDYNEKWLDFITTCRNFEDKSTYDLIIGGVANDRIFNTIELYFDRLIDRQEAIKRLQYTKPNLQLCIRNQTLLQEHLKYVESGEI